jgi:catechol 2,3-dioxygenase-like lactoylglutathione lyase family enzyme
MFQKIAFIHYPTQNLEKALEFYRDVLSFKLLVQNDEWVEFEVGGQRLALRQVNPMPPKPEDTYPNGAMIWLEARPIEKTISFLEDNKINIINELTVNSYGKTATFKDPDGNLIGLYEPPEKNA